MSSKSIRTIMSYTVSKFARFLRHSVVMNWWCTVTGSFTT